MNYDRVELQNARPDEQAKVLEAELPAVAPEHKFGLFQRRCPGSGMSLKGGFVNTGGRPFGVCENIDKCQMYFERADEI